MYNMRLIHKTTCQVEFSSRGYQQSCDNRDDYFNIALEYCDIALEHCKNTDEQNLIF